MSENTKKNIEEVYKDIREIHGDTYLLTENSTYINTNTKMELFCTRCNEPFLITPKRCKAGQGHRKCCREQAALNRTRSFEDLIQHSKDTFGENVFIYYKDTYTNWNTTTTIGCRLHGDFNAIPVNHLNTKYGCPTCWEEARGRDSQRKFTNDFESLAKLVHGDTYNYSKFIFVDYKTHGTIICGKHGEFTMTPDVHIGSKCGCSKCAFTFSKAQEEFTKYIESLGIEVERNYILPSKKELDVFIPQLNLAFEYNGLRYHSDLYRSPGFHLKKTHESLDVGIRLIHIFEDEWLKKRSVVERLIKTLTGKETLKFNARDCEFKEIGWLEYKNFVDDRHLQGSGAAPSFSFGLFLEKTLVAVMGFSHRDCNEGELELVRFCSEGLVRGGFSKLLARSLERLTGFNKVVSFSDTRWSFGRVYESTGFRMVKIIKPDYWYVNRLSREDKRAFQRKYLPNKLEVFDPNLSERQNCAANGLYRIFDCGKLKWEKPI